MLLVMHWNNNIEECQAELERCRMHIEQRTWEQKFKEEEKNKEIDELIEENPKLKNENVLKIVLIHKYKQDVDELQREIGSLQRAYASAATRGAVGAANSEKRHEALLRGYAAESQNADFRSASDQGQGNAMHTDSMLRISSQCSLLFFISYVPHSSFVMKCDLAI